ncbi:hypothetical protein AB0J86_15975 [Micromonospora sp. NPDC049559]|uniref:hypothetical protein n=1 Tax=Micromonospora sp. NPDC049559 TaxID=3155923 RepID=UPI00343CB383
MDVLNVANVVVGIVGGIASVVALLMTLRDRARPRPSATAGASAQPVADGDGGAEQIDPPKARPAGQPRSARLTLLLFTPWIFAAGFFLSGWFTNDVFDPDPPVMWAVTLVTGWAVSAVWITVVIKRTRHQELK